MNIDNIYHIIIFTYQVVYLAILLNCPFFIMIYSFVYGNKMTYRIDVAAYIEQKLC